MNATARTPIELVVLDMTGTTVRDDGAVQRTFISAAQQVGLARDDDELRRMTRYVTQTMGQSKIEVFTHLSGGDLPLARLATVAFEQAYAQHAAEGGCSALPGAVETFAQLRSAGIAVALTTGFSRTTADLIIDALGWRELIDASFTPADTGRGRPHPDLPLTALLRLEAGSVQAMAVAGDTTSDMRSDRRAGASVVAGCSPAPTTATSYARQVRPICWRASAICRTSYWPVAQLDNGERTFRAGPLRHVCCRSRKHRPHTA